MKSRMKKFLRSGRQLAALLVVACASGQTLFSLGPRPDEIAGVWIDSAQSSKTDAVAWVLSPNGDDRTVQLAFRQDTAGTRMATVRDTWNGWWYLSGKLSDSAHHAICYKRRPRDGATCLRFRLDTLNVPPTSRRRLTILGPPGKDWTQPRIFIAHVPGSLEP